MTTIIHPEFFIEHIESLAHFRGKEHGARDKENGFYRIDPLSGEWAGESIPELLGDLLRATKDEDEHEIILEAYENGYADGQE